ncbi:MAG TPA: ribosome biogenesis GTPase Der, partial [Desulfuromonadales bacterium]|nr:ribosome biogenesis GTPase Der [Desulfuromonadales bacterium]
DFPGVTRDRNYAEVTRYEKDFTLIDTGGFEPVSEDHLLRQMREQSQLAVEEADVIVFVLDVREGLTAADREVADQLRQTNKPVLYVVNKVDGDKQEDHAAEFYALGIESFFAVSAEHGRGLGDLVDQIVSLLPHTTKRSAVDSETRLAVIGRPNVGKSSLVNRLIGSERVVANPVSGTTRDSIDTRFVYNRNNYVLIDTAGIRRKGKVSQKLEKYSVVQALKAMDRAHIVLMIIDAEQGVTEQDATVAGYAHEKGRAVILIVNKWDLVAKDNATMGRYVEGLRRSFKFLPHTPIVFISAMTGQRVSRIMAEVEKVAEEFSRKISTPALNRAVQEAVEAHPPPMYRGRRLKFFYATQSAVRPPTFIMFVSRPEGVHFSYHRFLSNKIRDAFDLKNVPIRLKLRQRERD